MSLSNIDKNHMNELFISLNDSSVNLEIIKSNYANYAKLKLINKQINSLKKEALDIIKDIEVQNKLQLIKKNFKLSCGNKYYLYEKSDNTNYLSLISPNEWDNKDKFISAFLYDFDKQFIRID